MGGLGLAASSLGVETHRSVVAAWISLSLAFFCAGVGLSLSQITLLLVQRAGDRGHIAGEVESLVRSLLSLITV